MLMRTLYLSNFDVLSMRKEMEWKYFIRPSIRGLREGYLRVIGKQLCLLIFYLLSLIVLEQGD